MKTTEAFVKDVDNVRVAEMYNIIQNGDPGTSDVIYADDCDKHDDELLNEILAFRPVTARGAIEGKPVVFECNDSLTSGAILLTNGNNGFTKFTTESINDVTAFAKLLEDKFDARVYISSTQYHSDVFYYVVRFVVFGDRRNQVA